jgi:ankyrin repeat protein
VAEYLLDQGASVNATDGEQFSALHEATFNGHPRVAKLLIERGADIEKNSNDGSTALMVASAGGDVETVKLLLERRANSSHRLPKWGRTAIHSAASRGKAKVVELLLEAADCPIDDQDSAGATPLIMAVRNTPEKVARAHLLETVRFLVGAGANLNIQDKTGKTALMFVAKDNRLDEAKVLVEAGADLNIQDQEKGWSAIFFAAEKANVPMAQLLCEAGANLDLRDKKKKSVLDVAKTYSPTIHEMLERAKSEKKKPGKDEGREEINSQKQRTEDDAATVEQQVTFMPPYYKYDDRYPGIRFFGNPWKQTVTAAGAHISWREEIGVEFDIPPGAVPADRELELSVWPCCDGPFSLPDDYELASPVFLVSPSFEFSRDISLTMSHFSNLETGEDCEEMVFLSAPATSHMRERPVYRFRVLGEGDFKPHQNDGRILLTHFCTITTGRKRKKPSENPPSKRMRDNNRYVCQVYRDKEYDDIVLFSAFLHHELYFTQLKEFVKENFFSRLFPLSFEPISILEDKVALKWPRDIRWEIDSDKEPCQLTKEMMDSSDSFPYPPTIKLEIERAPNSSLQSIRIPVEILGITERGKKFILKPKLRQGTSTRYSLSSSTSSGPFSPPLQSPQTPLTQSLGTTRSLSSSFSLSNTAAGAPKPDDVITRKSLAEIAKKITSWKPLGLYLDLSRPQEEEIVQKYRENYGMQKRECLEVWKEMKGEGATYRAIISAVEEAGDKQLADGVRSLLEK